MAENKDTKFSFARIGYYSVVAVIAVLMTSAFWWMYSIKQDLYWQADSSAEAKRKMEVIAELNGLELEFPEEIEVKENRFEHTVRIVFQSFEDFIGGQESADEALHKQYLQEFQKNNKSLVMD